MVEQPTRLRDQRPKVRTGTEFRNSLPQCIRLIDKTRQDRDQTRVSKEPAGLDVEPAGLELKPVGLELEPVGLEFGPKLA